MSRPDLLPSSSCPPSSRAARGQREPQGVGSQGPMASSCLGLEGRATRLSPRLRGRAETSCALGSFSFLSRPLLPCPQSQAPESISVLLSGGR